MRRRGFSFSSAAASSALTCSKYTHTYPLLISNHYVVTLSETTKCSARAKNFILWFAAGSMHFNIVWHFLALFFTYSISYIYFRQLISFLNVFSTVMIMWFGNSIADSLLSHVLHPRRLTTPLESGKTKSTFNMWS